MRQRLRSLDQTHLVCEWNLVKVMIQVQILSPDSIEDQKKKKKKSLHRNVKGFYVP